MVLAPSFHEICMIAPLLAAALFILYRNRRKTGRIVDRIFLPLTPAIIAAASWAIIYTSIVGLYDDYSHAANTFEKVPTFFFRHLGFMFFPVKPSSLFEGPMRQISWLLQVSGLLQAIIAIAIIAVSLYLLIRGNRTSRFLVVWFHLALLPFCLVEMPKDWLELRYLYCAAMPACALIAIALSELLLARGGWRRWAAIAITTMAAVMAVCVTVILESKYDSQGRDESNTRRMEIIRRDLDL